MSQGWMRVREAAHLMGVSQSTVRRRMESEALRSRVGRSGRQEVFLPAKLRRALEAAQTEPCPPGHLERGKPADNEPATISSETTKPAQSAAASASTDRPAAPGTPAPQETEKPVSPGIDLVRRYERLAGGSLILAQKHSDELHKHQATAFEQLAHTRHQLRDVRRVALAGWVCCAAAVVFGLFFSITFGVGMNRAQAAAEASEAYAEQAEKQAAALEREHDRAVAAQPAQAPGVVPAAGLSATPSEAVIHPARITQDPRFVGRSQTGSTASVPTE
ncbi:MAG: hypothetical protein AAGA29_03675 [Planctomycetota bacterium]